MVEQKATKGEMKIDLGKIKKRRELAFYSNIASVTRSEIDVYIDFMQFPPEDDIAPSVRIYLSPIQAKKLLDALHNVLAAHEEQKSVAEEKK